MATDVQAKRRLVQGKKINYRTNNPQVTLEVMRETNGYLLLDFTHSKYSGKATIKVKIDGLDKKFYRHYLDDRKEGRE
jgi:hypothetical protein|tara:strand:- start:15276 stop:15509 length:234 start_codon:yes stop_codon:yes gene_type:complete